jgi:DMSO/TMAO reductase YedYZ molybdopterin-dependent catalytic subunit
MMSVERKLNRRELLMASLAGGAQLLGLCKVHGLEGLANQSNGAFPNGKMLGLVDVVGEPWAPLNIPLSEGLDGRLATDLSTVWRRQLVTPTERFYIRTRASQLLESQHLWTVKVGGLVARPFDLTLKHLNSMSRPTGVHLMECAGNDRSVHFGLLSVADWAGAPVSEILSLAKARRMGTRVLVSGLDRYTAESTTSTPGAGWIFTLKELESANAFLATAMNGRSLTKDHGAPVRLVAPGWYGCTCIKWVNEITLVEDNVEATSQMQEFAGRTQQQGIPKLARNYAPAAIQKTALPVTIPNATAPYSALGYGPSDGSHGMEQTAWERYVH